MAAAGTRLVVRDVSGMSRASPAGISATNAAIRKTVSTAEMNVVSAA